MLLESHVVSAWTPLPRAGRGRPFRALAAAALLLAGCATVPLATPEADAEAKQLQPPGGKALVYVFRDRLMAAMSKFPILVDGERVGELATGTYYVLEVDPGSHRIEFPVGRSPATLALQVEAGHRYFVRQWLERIPALFIMVDKPKLDEVTEEVGLRSLGRLVSVVRLPSR